MHKGIDLFRNDPDLGERKKSIIFLDIDGVIQPYHSQMRHEYDLDAMIEKLYEKYDPEVVRRGDVRRAKLNYMRERTGKAARIKSKDVK